MSRACPRANRATVTSCLAIVLGGLVACANADVSDVTGKSGELRGHVTRVIDGDTLDLVFVRSVGAVGNAGDTAESATRIRLAQIDAPEKSQPYGEQAKAALAAFTLGKIVDVEVVDIDKYGRTIAEIHLGDTSINSEMVRLGHAWAYTRYVSSLAIIDLEDEARRNDLGLWQLPQAEREPPWIWRHRGRRGSGAQEPLGEADTVCGEKRTCKEMVSCAEARFYLTECGVTRLDSDGDGIPCERKCRR